MADDNKNFRLVTVSGHGELDVEPDKAIVGLGVEARDRDQKAAQREVEKVVRSFMKACEDLGIEERHVKTTQLNIRPEYDWNNQTRERKLTGYYVHRGLQVDLRDISKLGLLLEQATDLGVNQASPPRFDTSKRDDLTREALAKAARDAKLNADTVATTLGARVGAVRRISTTNIGFRPPPAPMMLERGRAMAADAGGGADTFSIGEIKVTADVTVEFDLVVD